MTRGESRGQVDEHGRIPLHLWAGVAALTLVTLAFFWQPVLQRQVDAPLDLYYSFNPWGSSLPPGFHAAHNGGVTDMAFYFYPIQSLTWTEWREGIVPLWNPYNLRGTPLLGADQAAVFYPLTLFTLPFAFVDAWLLTGISKLFLAGLGMYLFLIRLRLHLLPALFGALAFMFCSFFVVWLYSTATSAAAYLPWVFLLVEMLVAAPRGYLVRPAGLLTVFGLALGVGCQFLGGHVEISTLILLAGSYYAVWRACFLWLPDWRQAARRLTWVGLGVVWGVGVGAIQWLPAVGTILQSATFAVRSISSGATNISLPPIALTTWLVPDMFGNPAIGIHQYYGSNNFNEATGYIGIVTIAAALWSWRWVQRTRQYNTYACFLCLLVLSAGIVYGIPAIHVLATLPPLKYIVDVREILVMSFAGAVLGAFGVDALCIRREPTRDIPPRGGWRRQKGARGRTISNLSPSASSPSPFTRSAWEPRVTRAMALVGGAALSVAVVLLVQAQIQPASDGPIAIRILRALGLGLSQGWLGYALPWSCQAGLFALVAWILLSIGSLAPPWFRRFDIRVLGISVAAMLVAVSFTELFVLGSSYNTSLPRSWVPPTPAAIQHLRQLAATNGISADNSTLIPNTSALYGLHDLRGYEPTAWSRDLDYFLEPGFVLAYYSPTALDRRSLANTCYELTAGATPGATVDTFGLPNNAIAGEIYGSRDVREDFIAARAGLASIVLLTATYSHRLDGFSLIIELRDRTTGQELVRRVVPAKEIGDNQYLPIHFRPLEHTMGHDFTITISAPEAKPGDAPTVAVFRGPPPRGFKMFIEHQPVASILSTRLEYLPAMSRGLTPVWTDGRTTIWHNGYARPRLYFASALHVVRTASEDLQGINQLTFNGRIARDVVVEANHGTTWASLAGNGAITPLHDSPGDVRVATRARAGRFLILTEADDPGWHASVDGQDVTVYHTNYLFQGVIVPGGRHEVRFYYRPTEFVVGASMTVGSLLLALLGCLLFWVRARRQQTKAS